MFTDLLSSIIPEDIYGITGTWMWALYAVSTLFGVAGIVCNVLVYQRKDAKRLLTVKLIGDIVWCLHYAFLGKTAGATITFLATCRELTFRTVDRKARAGHIAIGVFLVLACVSAVVNWQQQGPLSLLTALASFLSVISFGLAIPSLSRKLCVPIAISMWVYNLLVRSLMGLVNESFTFVSTLVGMWRHDRKRKEN